MRGCGSTLKGVGINEYRTSKIRNAQGGAIVTAEKTIIRTPKGAQRPYFTVARSTAQDKRLSLAARGLLMYLLSKPDDWKITKGDLKTQGVGRDQANALLKELREFGYLVTEMIHDEKTKRFTEKIDRVYEIPCEAAILKTSTLESRITENHDSGKPPLHNTESTEDRETQKTDSLSANADSAQPNEPPKGIEKPKTKRGGKPKGETVPRPEFNAMCDAIVSAHKYPEIVWKTDMAGVIRDAAKTLCLAGYKPEHIPIIHAACKQKFTDFSPAAMAKHAATILDPTKPAQSQNGNGTHAATPNQPRHARAPRQMTDEEIAAEDAKWAAMNAPEGGAS